MTEFIAWLSRIFSSWRPWIVVPPWEIAVRVRLGKNAVALPPGPHFRIPFIDVLVCVNTRLRITTCPPVTLGKPNGRVAVRKASAGYTIVDPVAALLYYNTTDSAVDSMLQAEVAKMTTAEDCLNSMRETFGSHGIRIEFVRFVEDAEMRAFRLLSSDWSVNGNGLGQQSGARHEF
jgi:regulator of protease activity HflC (stomatin/prohibitin superfamily)